MDKGSDRPTKKQLEEQALQAAEEAEKMIEEEKPEPSKEIEEEKSPIEENQEEEPTPSEEIPEVDYKKKAIEQGRENIILNAKNDKNEKLNSAVDEASKITDIPEETIRVEYPEWDDMTTTEKRLAKENYINNKRFEVIHKASLEGKNIEEWNKKVESFVTDPETLTINPELEGKGEEFKLFASKQSRRGVDFQTLVSAFLFDESKTMKKPSKGQMFEKGSGGPNDKMKPKSDKISIDQARVLRNTNYEKYKEMVKAGKIETIDL